MKKLTSLSLATVLLATTQWAQAATTAITHATLYTATEQGILTDATIVIKDDKIVAINPDELKADTVIDAKGKIVTPGFIGSMNTVGLVEVNAVSASRDASDKKADITFSPSLAFNPKSTIIAYSRKGGITADVVIPTGGDDIFKGQTFVADLSGEFDSIIADNNAVFVVLGAQRKGSRAAALQNLINTLTDRQQAVAEQKNAKKSKDKAKQPSRKDQIIDEVLAGKKPLVVAVDRATDILHVLKLKQEFNLDLILANAADAILVADEIAKAKVPVIMSAMDDLPNSFDSLHQSLTNAATLANAGVKVILSVNGDAQNLYQLRFDAGNAIANGMTVEQALQAITANVADAFHLNRGKLAKDMMADLVLWSDDPFELSSHVEAMWINGKAVSTESRHDKLRERYRNESDMPPAYRK
jgi:imidazolonepropionase-like amidohydrolase